MVKTEREHREDICQVGRLVFQKGWVAANDGNISIRLNEREVLCTPTMVSKGFIKPEDLCVVDYEGKQLRGTRKRSSEILLHLAVYKNNPKVNAFALPGGPMFIQTGLFQAVDNEAQLAGVMAHEMSHVILRHGTNQASKANMLQIPAMLAGAVLGGSSILGHLAQLGVGVGFNSVLLKFSRTAESEADAMGARIMSEAGYNPIELAHFFDGGPEGHIVEIGDNRDLPLAIEPIDLSRTGVIVQADEVRQLDQPGVGRGDLELVQRGDGDAVKFRVHRLFFLLRV